MGQEQEKPQTSQRRRRVGLRGHITDPEGVTIFPGETGKLPGSIELSGEQLETFEMEEALQLNQMFNKLCQTMLKEEVKRKLGLD